jgi:hypothetical protein
MQAVLDRITDGIMNALMVSAGPVSAGPVSAGPVSAGPVSAGPVVANQPNPLLPWWATAEPQDLYMYSRHITDGNDVFHAVAMGLTVRLHTKDQLFVAYDPEKMAVTNILTKEGEIQFRENVTAKGWRFLHFLCDEAQKTQTLPAGRLARICWFMSEKAVDEITEILFSKVRRSKKRKLDGHFCTDYLLNNRWRYEKSDEYKRLVTPLLPNGLSGEVDDTDFIGGMLQKVRQGIFEDSGKLCNYKRSAHCTSYQNEKKKGEAVVSPPLDNAWALFLTAALKLRVTVWSRTNEGSDDVQLLNNDAIIQDLWGCDLKENPDIVQQFDQLLVCRPQNGMLGAVQRYNDAWPQSRWSRLDSGLIPTDYRGKAEEDEHITSEEEVADAESSDDEPLDVEWTRSQAQDAVQPAFEVRIIPKAHVIVRFLEHISVQLAFHIKDRVYFDTSTYASVNIKITVEDDDIKKQLWADIRDFAVRVTTPEYWNDKKEEKEEKSPPTGYQVMSGLTERVHVVWFLPRLTTSHLRSFLEVRLVIWSNSMSGTLHVTHVTENKQILLRNELYRVIKLTNVAEFVIMFTELHKSDYMFLRRDHPAGAKVDIKILQFKIPHPGIGRNLPDEQLQNIVSAQSISIIKAVAKLLGVTLDPEPTEKYVYNFNSNSKKEMRITIHVQNDGPYTEIALEQF